MWTTPIADAHWTTPRFYLKDNHHQPRDMIPDNRIEVGIVSYHRARELVYRSSPIEHRATHIVIISFYMRRSRNNVNTQSHIYFSTPISGAL